MKGKQGAISAAAAAGETLGTPSFNRGSSDPVLLKVRKRRSEKREGLRDGMSTCFPGKGGFPLMDSNTEIRLLLRR